jgi:very-short-patch-repair endonuclease
MKITLKTNRARLLRKHMTDAEQALWQRIRLNQLQVKFRRQTPIGSYFVDFYCHEFGLVVELDGSQHIDQVEYDEARTLYLQSLGLRVIRFWNNDVLLNIETVLEEIMRELGSIKH